MTDLKQFVRDLNEAWKNHRYDDLYAYFHEKVVMLPPGGSQPIVGVESMIQSYRQFGSMGTIHAFHILALTLYEFGSITMCHLRFDVDYEIESGRFREKGVEVYAIDASGLQPKVIWRTQLPLNENDA